MGLDMTPMEEPTWFQYLFYRLVNALWQRVISLGQTAEYLAHYPQFGHIGTDVTFEDDVAVNRPGNISIGDGSFVGQGVSLNAVDELVLGEQVLVAAGCRIMTWNHVISDRSIDLDELGKESAPVRIGDGVWLGYDAIVLPGVEIGKGAVIGAGAVVTNDVEPYTVVGGVPAKRLGERTSEGIKWDN